jgi:hypothetical protein
METVSVGMEGLMMIVLIGYRDGAGEEADFFNQFLRESGEEVLACWKGW